MYSFNIICTTLGRPTLPRLLKSLEGQLKECDVLTLISDDNHNYVINLLESENLTYRINHIIEPGGKTGMWGHALLNKHINNVDGDFIMFADDDDRYSDDAFKIIREYVKEKKLYIFKHKDKKIHWKRKVFEVGNIGKCMGVIPNTKTLPDFKLNGGGDGLFYSDLSKIMDYEFVDKIIYIVKDN